MSNGPSRVDVVISVAAGSLAHIQDVAKGLEAAGLSVKKVMPTIGSITGSVEKTRMGALGSVGGVTAVEITREYKVPPPGSKVQ